MKLKIFLPSTGQSWTLKPNLKPEYIIGKEPICDISINGINIKDRHAKLSFNSFNHNWYITDLSSQNIIVNNQQVNEAIITTNIVVILGGEITLNIVPENTINTPNVAAPQPIPVTIPQPTYSPSNQGIKNQVFQPQNNPPLSPNLQPQNQLGSNSQKQYPSPSLREFTWSQYVKEQVKNQNGWLNKIATKFYLITGFRNTPWIRNYGKTGFDAFDGYIIPNFSGSAEEVAREIEQKLGQLAYYEDTNCYIARLTDGHIADSATQSFLGIELFPIKRGKKPDYRRFCVVAYHRVRTYLLVENYGNDLYVNWITRFEPEPNPFICQLTFWLSCLFFIKMFFGAGESGQYELMLLAPICIFIWLTYYGLTPYFMKKGGVIPKKANGRLFVIISFIFMLTILLIIPPLIIFGLLEFMNYKNTHDNRPA